MTPDAPQATVEARAAATPIGGPSEDGEAITARHYVSWLARSKTVKAGDGPSLRGQFAIRSVAMREQTGQPSRRDSNRNPVLKGRQILAALATLAAFVMLTAACSGERPELILTEGGATDSADGTGDGASGDGATGADGSQGSVPAETTVPPPPLQAADCVTATGPGPWPVPIEATATPTVACFELAGHHRVEFVNNTPDTVSFGLAGLSVDIAPAANFITEPAGTFLQPGLTSLSSLPHPVSGLWLADAAENTMAGQPVGLSSIGPVSVGATPEAVSTAVGGAALSPGEGDCYVTTIAGDPYSPLFTINNGTVSVIQVATPGQLTRSEIGVGSSEGDVLAAYGQQIESIPSPDGNPSRKLLVFVPNDEADKQFRLAFVLENDMVVGLRNGLTDQALTDPNCAG